MLSLIELLNRILALIQSAIRNKKQEEVHDTYEQINKNLKDSVTAGSSSSDSGVFTPNGEPPTGVNLRNGPETK